MDTYSRDDLKKMKVVELRRLARDKQLIGYSRLRKADLIDRLLRHMKSLAAAETETKGKKRRGSMAGLKALLHEPGGKEPRAADAPALDEAPAAASVTDEAPPAKPDPGFAEMRDPSWYPPELPAGYGLDRLTLMIRDPHWLFCYWEVTEEMLNRARAELSGPTWKVLRIHLLDEAEAVLDGWEHGLPEEASSWYVHTGRPGARFRAELGLIDASGRYRRLVASNTVQAPLDSPSERWDEEWVGLSRETWERLERAARPFPGSLGGIDFFKQELKALAAARLGASEISASHAATPPRTERASKP